jgi:hypothetical protein
LVLTTLAVLVLSACTPPQFLIRNKTEHDWLTVRVESFDNPREVAVDLVNSLTAGGDGCHDEPVVAYDPEGNEVARLEEGACEGRTWVVDDQGGHLED